ncbi:hypothetical protein NQ318_004643 [Aromia moschata]|uniref:Equilibrative nucleoside transporter 3 n=1 Tax=Aromia moschata TaxID=1265417 RepID=A0AAV8Y7D9_9CUCU|nr:hypothetical protein NQ318_004643 [Aromia moschata]
MAYSVNTTPLLQEYDSENEDERQIQPNTAVINDKPLFFKPLEPRDRYYMSFFIFYLLGVVTLLPWNFYVTADDYWMYKFRNISLNSSVVNASAKRTPLQAEFTSYLSLASSVPNLIFLALNTAISHRVSLNKRVLGSLVSMLILMIATLVFVNLNTDQWQQIFFVVTLTCIVLLNVTNIVVLTLYFSHFSVCSAIFSGSIFGVVGKFSPIYITAVIGGQALGGIFAAVAEIVSLSIGASSTHAAFVYYVIGNVTIVISIICYVVLEKTVFFNYHFLEHPDSNEFDSKSGSLDISYKVILKKMWCYGLSVFLTLAFTLSVYPGVTVLIESEGKGHGNRWNDVFFVPTIAYLLFSVGDYLGRILAGRLLKPKNISALMILSIARFIFIPLLMLCNAQPRHHWAVVFDKDYEYILILFMCALSNGYLANIVAIFVPKVVDHHEKEIASSILTIFMGIGLTLGSAVSLFMVRLL